MSELFIDTDGITKARISSGYESTIGTTVPSKAILMGISDGSNIRPFSGNLQGTLLASAARTASTTSATQTNYNARGVIISLDITAASGSGGLAVRLWTLDPVTQKIFYFVAAPTSILATGTYGYEFYPGSSAAVAAGTALINQRSSVVLPRSWGVYVIHADGSSYTYSLGYSLIN